MLEDAVDIVSPKSLSTFKQSIFASLHLVFMQIKYNYSPIYIYFPKLLAFISVQPKPPLDVNIILVI